MIWRCRDYAIDLSRVRVMAILNVTPDSFSGDGLYGSPEEVLRRARRCVEEGADLIDIGGESTRPGATPLPWEEEWARVEPVAAAVAALGVPASIDTYHPETAERALAAGVSVLNCVFPEPVPEMAEFARESGAGLIIPSSALDALPFREELSRQTVIDPMIGFGTTREEDIALLGSLRRLAMRAPVCAGVSRKRIVKRLAGKKVLGKNPGGTLAAALWCAMNGASVLRVHDVAETVQALRVTEALAEALPGGGEA